MWQRRNVAGLTIMVFGLVVAVAGAAQSSGQTVALGVLTVAAGAAYRARAVHNYWVTCRFRPSTNTIIVEPTHPRFDAAARRALRPVDRMTIELPRELGDGLVLRAARLDDGAQLIDFNGAMHADEGLPASMLEEWTRDLFESPHPTFRPDRDVTVVEDTATGRIVSALFLIPQVWSYAGVPVKVGQPELIATHPDYRRRGLVRAQFDVIHDWSKAAGQLWQFISGISWYYRQFGYSYALDLPPRPVLWLGPKAPPPSPAFSVRPATTADIGILAAIEAEASSGTALGPFRGADGFAVELARRPRKLGRR